MSDPGPQSRYSFVLLVLAVACGWVGWTATQRTWLVDGSHDRATQAAGLHSIELRVDINTATAEQLAALPGVGPMLADRLVSDRQERGAFRSVDDLDRVRGIGPKILATLRPFVHVAGAAPPPDTALGDAGRDPGSMDD